MLPSYIALLAALQSPADLPGVSAPVTLTADTMELTDAGVLDFVADPGGFNIVPPQDARGMIVRVTLWLDADGKPISCDTGQAEPVEVAKTGCAQLLRGAHFRLFPGLAAGLRRGFVTVAFAFHADPAAPRGIRLHAYDDPTYRNVAIVYPPDETPEAERLTRADGRFQIQILPDDYPPIAIREGLESRSALLLGIARDGSVRSCRPISGPGLRTAMLDNGSCVTFLRRGHFEFVDGAPSYKGLRYTRSAISWKMPKD